MTIAELIEKLESLPGDMPVLHASYDAYRGEYDLRNCRFHSCFVKQVGPKDWIDVTDTERDCDLEALLIT